MAKIYHNKYIVFIGSFCNFKKKRTLILPLWQRQRVFCQTKKFYSEYKLCNNINCFKTIATELPKKYATSIVNQLPSTRPLDNRTRHAAIAY